MALQLIDQISEDAYDPTQYVDEEKKRILAAIDEKIAGKQVVASAHDEAPESAQVIDLMEALRASLGKKTAAAKPVVVEPARPRRGGRSQGAQGRQAGCRRAHRRPKKPPQHRPRARARKDRARK